MSRGGRVNRLDRMTTRRDLLIAPGAIALAAPFRAFAQQQNRNWHVGFVSARRVDFVDTDTYYGPFRQGMRELGYVEGKNLVIEWRSGEGDNERLPRLAAELVNLKVDVIVTSGAVAISAAQKATTTIPIVIGNTGDPVGSGFVKSLARPGGNITGFSGMAPAVRLKQLEILLAMVPRLSRVAVLLNPSNTANIKSREMVEAAAQKYGVRILHADAQTPQEIDNAFSLMRQQNAGALIVFAEPLFQQQKGQIAGLIAKHRLPCMVQDRIYLEAGVLMSYGTNLADQNRRMATYVDKILKGANPAELPVEQPTIFELFISGRTAKELGLKIPQSLLIMADKVIE